MFAIVTDVMNVRKFTCANIIKLNIERLIAEVERPLIENEIGTG